VAPHVTSAHRAVPASHATPAAAPAPAQLAGLEVSNGAGIRYLATQTARKLSELGVTVMRITNYPVFSKARSEVHYRDGHLAEAQAMKATLPVDAKLVHAKHLRPGVNVRLVLGKDLGTSTIARVGEPAPAPVEVVKEDAPPSRQVTADRPRTAPVRRVDKVARAGTDTGWRFL
jgi:hypothetical protein